MGPVSFGVNGSDLNIVQLDGLDSVLASAENLGLKSVRELLGNEEGISLDDVEEVFESSLDTVSDSFGGALEQIANYRSSFGAVSSRLGKVLEVLDVSHENIAAANSRLRDVDYASEIATLTKANILVQAGASLLVQGNIPAQVALQLVKNIDK